MINSFIDNTGYNPIELGKTIEKIILKEDHGIWLRKYYRFRGGKWYGGIATADCIGCNLRCKFCWAWRQRDYPERFGNFYSPEQVASKLIRIANEKSYKNIRISGGEPTLGFEHLIQVLENLKNYDMTFILETNGIYFGYYNELSPELSNFENVHVRVSIKGCTPEDFHSITGAKKEFFQVQINALKNLIDSNVRAHPAVMESFSEEESCKDLREKLGDIDSSLYENYEEEFVFLYPHVVEILRKNKIWPRKAFYPNSIPEKYI
ncbi:radical SAM protein [Fervidicoccus fontis]|uniref:Radical SAM protein n=1 Tax=Fervidicoccus fontis TaxID=683846 RepID=A0A7C2ZAK5_9CREN|nr:radical SAM protein [Fervidicoccus fontis]PMB76637.1 MAG: molybdenum cofactor biosynthesis protein MoaA [Fervidicoccus fontis]HEW63889.1 radical SAM protein [Fervidicoccus fontis]